MNPIDSVGEGGGLVGWGRRPKAREEQKRYFLQIVVYHIHQEVCLLVNM